METFRQIGIFELASIGAGGGVFLIQRGLWYQGNKQGWVVRSLSVVIGICMFLLGMFSPAIQQH
jgi:hypothetical protein